MGKSFGLITAGTDHMQHSLRLPADSFLLASPGSPSPCPRLLRMIGVTFVQTYDYFRDFGTADRWDIRAVVISLASLILLDVVMSLM